MKIITSPSKLMSIDFSGDMLEKTKPQFIEEAGYVQSFLKKKSPEFLANLMEISPRLADENWKRNQDWKENPTAQKSCPAIFAFTGEVYRGLDVKTLDRESLAYLEKNYRILSGLYGMLKPSSTIMLYRLEMGRKFSFGKYKNLYDFWKEKISRALLKELGENEFLLNLASQEYAKVLDKKMLENRIVEVNFYETKNGKQKNIFAYTKHARGLMARYCAENKIKTVDEIKDFCAAGYVIDEKQSTVNRLIFLRQT
ncbi:MAG: YaaA family protein [Bergeyella sp.]|nr:YaaA family protein [Bergeyella sp.]